MWKRAHEPNPDIPAATEHDWEIKNGMLEPIWFEGQSFPQVLADIASPAGEALESDDSDNNSRDGGNYESMDIDSDVE